MHPTTTPVFENNLETLEIRLPQSASVPREPSPDEAVSSLVQGLRQTVHALNGSAMKFDTPREEYVVPEDRNWSPTVTKYGKSDSDWQKGEDQMTVHERRTKKQETMWA
jgi:hypothetical protein